MESDSVLISDQFSQQIIYIQYSEMGMEFIGFWEISINCTKKITIREGLKKKYGILDFPYFSGLGGFEKIK